MQRTSWLIKDHKGETKLISSKFPSNESENRGRIFLHHRPEKENCANVIMMKIYHRDSCFQQVAANHKIIINFCILIISRKLFLPLDEDANWGNATWSTFWSMLLWWVSNYICCELRDLKISWRGNLRMVLSAQIKICVKMI